MFVDYADKEECEDNDDNNCNERTHEIKQDNDCKAENTYEKIGSMGAHTNNNQFYLHQHPYISS